MSSSYTYTAPSLNLIANASVVKQGAEARVYAVDSLLPSPKIYWPSDTNPPSSSSAAPTPVILKHRFPKTYRHPTLDASLTRTRLQFEARALARCARAGVTVPRVLWVDEPAGVVGMEKIEGWSVREVLGGGAEGEMEVDRTEEVEREAEDEEEPVVAEEESLPASEGLQALERLQVTPEALMTTIGAALARLHATSIIHGDLTTSNMMVRLTPNAETPYEIVSFDVAPVNSQVLIDFGLASTATMPEQYAVDLYVLERAFASTHPASEGLYAGVLEAYAAGLGEKKWTPIEQKLKEG